MHVNECRFKLPETDDKYNQLARLQNYFKYNFNLTPIMGAEIEFYIYKITDIEAFSAKIGYEVKLEKGRNQYEINFFPTSNLVELAREIAAARNKIIETAASSGGAADFRSKPYKDDYGSSMQFHLNFLEDNDIEKYIQILCKYVNKYLDYFLPETEDYKRLDERFTAPTHIAWGGNNRTVLIRIPNSLPRRLEHRLAGANADPAAVIFAVLDSVKCGLTDDDKEIFYLPKIYGNAFDAQYKLQKIEKNNIKPQ